MKMELLFFLTLLLFYLVFANAQCTDNPPTPEPLCVHSASSMPLGDFPNFPSTGTKKLTVSFVAKMLYDCSQSGDLHYFSIGINISPHVKIADFIWNNVNNEHKIITVNNANTPVVIISKPMSSSYSALNEWIEFGIGLDIAGNNAFGGINTQEGIVASSIISNSFLSTWIFHTSSIQFYIGSALTDSSSRISCKIEDMIVRYDDYTWVDGSMLLGNSFTQRIAYYPFAEFTGTTLNSIVDSSYKAYLGSSSAGVADPDETHMPKWTLGDQGLKFTQTSQYITLPNYPLSSTKRLVAISLSLSFWVKISSSSAAGSYVFRLSSGSVTDNFALKIGTGADNVFFNGAIIIPNVMIAKNTWALVSVNFAVKTDMKTCLLSFYAMPGSVNQNSYMLSTPIDFTSSSFRIGGPPSFIGHIAHFKVRSPGATAIFSSTNCASSGQTVLGTVGSQDDIAYNCDASCGGDECFNALPSGCMNCAGGTFLYKAACVTPCPLGTYPSGTSCRVCPEECKSCTSSVTCQSCNTGFTLQGTKCLLPGVIPPALTCHSTCKTCFSSQSNGCFSCFEGKQLSGSTCISTHINDEIETLSSIKDIAGTVAKATLIAASFVFVGPQAVSFGVVSKMIQYIKYLAIPYSDELIYILHNWNSDFLTIDFGIEMPQEIEEDQQRYQPVPAVFAAYDLHPSFLYNFWDELIFMGIVMAVLVCIFVLETITRTSSMTLLSSFLKKIRIRVQNFLLILFYDGYAGIIFLAIIEIRTEELGLDLSAVSLALWNILGITGVAIFVLHFKLLLRYQNLKQKDKQERNGKHLKKFIEQNEGVKVLFEFKDKNIIQQGFLLIFVFRDVLFSFVLTTLFEYPRVEAGILTFFSVAMLIYIIIKRPMETIDLLQLICCELVLLVVNCNIVVMSIFNSEENFELRIVLSKIIIYLIIGLSFIPNVFITLNLGFTIRGTWKKRKQRGSRNMINETSLNNTTTTTDTFSSFMDSKKIERRPPRTSVRENGRRDVYNTDLNNFPEASDDISLNQSNSMSANKSQSRISDSNVDFQTNLDDNSLSRPESNLISRTKRNDSIHLQPHHFFARSRSQLKKPSPFALEGNSFK